MVAARFDPALHPTLLYRSGLVSFTIFFKRLQSTLWEMTNCFNWEMLTENHFFFFFSTEWTPFYSFTSSSNFHILRPWSDNILFSVFASMQFSTELFYLMHKLAWMLYLQTVHKNIFNEVTYFLCALTI